MSARKKSSPSTEQQELRPARTKPLVSCEVEVIQKSKGGSAIVALTVRWHNPVPLVDYSLNRSEVWRKLQEVTGKPWSYSPLREGNGTIEAVYERAVFNALDVQALRSAVEAVAAQVTR